MSILKPIDELEEFYNNPDPWNYENNPDNINRRAMLLSVLPKKRYRKVLDIGCGDGFITERIPGDEIIGLDVSVNAIQHAKKKKQPHIQYVHHSLFDLPELRWSQQFDLIIITGVLYPQYIGESKSLAYMIIDGLLQPGGHLVCCHIEELYNLRFPYISLHREYYPYREYSHVLEVYLK